jgi:small ligand-binding sensory domain FIST
MSAQADAVAAATRCVEQIIRAAAGVPVDVVFLFISGEHIEYADAIATIVRERLGPRHLIGTSSEGVVGGPVEVERTPAVSMLAMTLPGVKIHTFTDSDIPPIPDDLDPDTVASLRQGIGTGPDLRATFLFVDSFSVPMVRLLPALNAARRAGSVSPESGGVMVGGMVSGASGPGKARLILDERVRTHGLVGMSLSGDIRIDALVSQGCRPIGQPFVITKARGNLILELGGRPALEAIQETVNGLPPGDQDRLHNSLLMGRVVNEYKDRFGRSDFLIRAIIGVDKDLKAVAIADIVRPGITVQLQLRDAETATQDLLMLLDAQQLHSAPLGALLFTCNGRGTRLFAKPNHDASRIVSAFAGATPGEGSAKPGQKIDPSAASLPLAGFFAAGEIGPIGNESFLHGQTACAVLFRAPITAS